jgi:hypothetical protein
MGANIVAAKERYNSAHNNHPHRGLGASGIHAQATTFLMQLVDMLVAGEAMLLTTRTCMEVEGEGICMGSCREQRAKYTRLQCHARKRGCS